MTPEEIYVELVLMDDEHIIEVEKGITELITDGYCEIIKSDESFNFLVRNWAGNIKSSLYDFKKENSEVGLLSENGYNMIVDVIKNVVRKRKIKDVR